MRKSRKKDNESQKRLRSATRASGPGCQRGYRQPCKHAAACRTAIGDVPLSRYWPNLNSWAEIQVQALRSRRGELLEKRGER